MREVVRMVNRARGERGDVYIGRPSKWGNPFVIGRDGTRNEVIEKYRQWLWEQIQDGSITKEDLLGLAGKTLECWCSPLPCHGDVLERAIEWAGLPQAEQEIYLMRAIGFKAGSS